MYELKVTTRFAAAHQLNMVGEKCENLHGHNWKIEVYVGGEKLNSAGVLMDFGDVKKHVRDIMQTLLPLFSASCQPSSENIARYIADELRSRITEPGIRITRVAAWESDDACATYIPD